MSAIFYTAHDHYITTQSTEHTIPRGPPLAIFINVIQNHAESWLDSLIPDLIPCWFLLPNKDLRYHVMRFYECALKVIVQVLIPDSRITCTDSASDSTRFLKPSTWFGIVSGPSYHPMYHFIPCSYPSNWSWRALYSYLYYMCSYVNHRICMSNRNIQLTSSFWSNPQAGSLRATKNCNHILQCWLLNNTYTFTRTFSV